MAFLNVYKSGYYHRVGKPRQYNCHPGDLYATLEDAQDDIDPAARHLYLGTYPVEIPEAVLGQVNPPDSEPLPLSQTKRMLREAAELHDIYTAASHFALPAVRQVEAWSLETGEDEGRAHPALDARLAAARKRLAES